MKNEGLTIFITGKPPEREGHVWFDEEMLEPQKSACVLLYNTLQKLG